MATPIQDRRPCGCVVVLMAPCPGCDLGDVWSPCPHAPRPARLCDDCNAAVTAAVVRAADVTRAQASAPRPMTTSR